MSSEKRRIPERLGRGSQTDEERPTHDHRLPRDVRRFQLLSLRDQDRMHENAGGEGGKGQLTRFSEWYKGPLRTVHRTRAARFVQVERQIRASQVGKTDD